MTKFKDNHLYYLPLGGVGIFGANCYLYRYQKKWIMIDCGLAFNNDKVRYPGVDIMFPDLSFVEEIRDDLLGVICTHGHEDHIGAIANLYSQLNCPIYASEFANRILERKFAREKKKAPILKSVKPYEKIKLGKFNIEFMPVIHSVPGAFSIKIQTKEKTLIHAGDWRLDNNPILEFSDEKQWKQAGKDEVDVFVCESSNFGGFSEGQEYQLVKSLAKIFKSSEGCVFTSIFASNVARIKVVIQAAKKAGRCVGLIGYSLRQNYKIAEDLGLLHYDFLTEDDMATIPKEEMVIIATGSQGQKNSGLYRLANNQINYIDIDSDDTVILSSRAIPGNEDNIRHISNKIKRLGAELITCDDDFVHVSGHSSPDNIAQMYKWLKPNTLIAMHGEQEQVEANINLANSLKIPNSLIVNNGEIYDIYDKKVIETIETGLVCKNHGKIVSINGSSIKEKKRISFNGACIVSICLKEEDSSLLKTPKVTLLGLDDHKIASQNTIANHLEEELKNLSCIDTPLVRRLTKKKIKEMFQTEKPIIEIHLF
ncbi:MAG: ribonuclease J [Alphaproteobacteria bacterium]|nr:ribonuclease J [Alphaproteobacteria bacterium]